jgi:hypothetical protein
VHWSDFNRRNDSWISADQINHHTTKVLARKYVVALKPFLHLVRDNTCNTGTHAGGLAAEQSAHGCEQGRLAA